MEKLEQTKYEKLFSTPLFRFNIADAGELNAELLNEGNELRKHTESVSKSNRGGWHSPGNLFEQSAPCFQRLAQFAETAIFDCTTKISPKTDLKKAWVEGLCMDELQPTWRIQRAPYPSRRSLVWSLLRCTTKGGDWIIWKNRVS